MYPGERCSPLVSGFQEGEVLVVLSKKSVEMNAIERFQNIVLVDCSVFLPFEEPEKRGRKSIT